ncbi:MAG: cytochrome c oxidase subunit 3 [Syntrophales bacterium]
MKKNYEDVVINEHLSTDSKSSGVWIFVSIDMAIFLLFFIVFLSERNNNVSLFISSQEHLNITIGFINTVFLITSSWLVASAIQSIRRNAPHKSILLLNLALLFGFLFVFFKLYEYTEKFNAGISIIGNYFYLFYFLLTFIHFAHVIGGIVALFIVRRNLVTSFDEKVLPVAEVVGVYWHMVDLLWIVLFPLLYLLR